MGQINFRLDNDLDKKFRDKIVKTKGYHHGHLSEALHEAIQDWINKK